MQIKWDAFRGWANRLWHSKFGWAILFSLLALGLRLNLAFHGPMEWDESVYTESASRLSQAIRSADWGAVLDSSDNIEHPQWSKLVYAVALLPYHPIAVPVSFHAGDALDSITYWPKLLTLRLISVVFGVAAVFLLSLVNPLAGLFLAVQTMAVKYTSVIYLDSLPAFASLAAFLSAGKALDLFLDPTRARGARTWLKWLILSAAGMGMAVASKYMYGAVAAAIGLVGLARAWRSKRQALVGLLGWGALCLFFFFLFDPILWHAPLQRLQESIQFNLNYAAGQHVTVDTRYPFWQPLYWLMLSIPQHSTHLSPFFQEAGNYPIVLDSLIFLCGLVGLPALFQKNKTWLVWLGIGFVFLLLWNTKWPQYVLLVLPPFCMAAASGVEFFIQQFPWPRRK
jgi:4-amino-4-deoxy-L-arabinose transferase-like glycosyltransferase